MSKVKNKTRVSFVGMNAEDVTGSMIHIQTSQHQILLEAGLYQTSNLKESYIANSRRFSFKPKEIEYIFLNHLHIDHCGLLPRLYAEGCNATIITPEGTKKLLELMLLDSAYIFQRDNEILAKKYNMSPHPIYGEEDVKYTCQFVKEYTFNTVFSLDEEISFKFVPSGHIINAAQLELWIKENNNTKKIAYTSDLGNIKFTKYYSGRFEPIEKANLVIGECTYADKSRITTNKDRLKDLEKMKSIIENICCDNGGRVLIPTFSLDRTQNILTFLYDIFGQDQNFKIPIVIDSPLAVNITKLYDDILLGNDWFKFHQVMQWENIRLISDYEESKALQNSLSPIVILSSSGFMIAGRSRQWAKKILPDNNSHILFVGYSDENSLASKIKAGKQKTITIDGKAYKNKCGVTDLKSFSSHMQRDDLLEYYSNICCEKIALVHGEYKSKCEFAKELQNEISNKNKCHKVISVNKSTEILI